MIRDEIMECWEHDYENNLQSIMSLNDSFPAYTIQNTKEYGVAIPISKDIRINETFSGAVLISKNIHLVEYNEAGSFLCLLTGQSTDKGIFSALCEQFVFPGRSGEFREDITSSPLKWWMEMRKIFGNKNVEDTVYDTIGELWAYKYLVDKGMTVIWNGPNGGTSDLETDEMMVEVKSTVVRSRKEIIVHGKNQLVPPPGKPLFLYFCEFELSTTTGVSIDDIIIKLAESGHDVSTVNHLLEKKGFKLGRSSRLRKAILWRVLKYKVDDVFPRITSSSFVGGHEPSGTELLSYSVNLANLPFEVIWEGNENDI